MPLVRDFLKTKTLAELEAAHGVKSRIAGHKVSLNYSQIEATDSDPLSQQCRGLILRRADKGLIDPDLPLGDSVTICRPFDRFFNLGQGAAAAVDFNHSDTRFFEKLDGTMCILYFDDVEGRWHVATRSVPEADLFIDGFESFTFRTLFERAILDMTGWDFGAWVEGFDTSLSLMFELTTPVNRIVVPYEKFGVTLLGARVSATGRELDPVELAPSLSVPHAPIYRLGSVAEMVDFVSRRDPQGYEGIVVCDPLYRRVKVKSAGYLALNKVRDSVAASPRALLELVLLEKLDDVSWLLQDQYIKLGEKMQDGLRKIFCDYAGLYAECMSEADSVTDRTDERLHRKSFALAVTSRGGWMAPSMDQYIGRSVGVREWVDGKRDVDGGWSRSFLDFLLRSMGM